ncbi:MAG: hypothetical protein NT007_01800 [Candidatus Kapabacteria bacterium]|nr:hypothetical protein [Candidatus Kapabacteria bacterium]
MQKNKQNVIIFWILSIVMMAAFGRFQRATGPSYPVSGEVTINKHEIDYSLPRSSEGDDIVYIKIKVPDTAVMAVIDFKKYPSYDEYKSEAMTRDNQYFKFLVPRQANAGKISYKIHLKTDTEAVDLNKGEPVVIRFRGSVPLFIMIFHILFMAISLTLCFRTMFEVFMKGNNLYRFTLATCISLMIGGMILGPIVQKFAFGAFWTGWPFGHDLTDNKTIAGIILWLLAVWRLRKDPNATKWVLAAVILLVVVYFIPHSVLGSEIDYTKVPQR